MRFHKKGFTLVEIMVVVSIIVVLLGIIMASISSVRSKSRDAQVKADKQMIILALVRAREASPNFSYPGQPGWQCLKTSGTCWNGQLGGGATVPTAITPYLPGGVIPIPPGVNASQFRTGAYIYNPTPSIQGQLTGSFIVWSQERPILPGECNSGYTPQLEPGIYYCYEALPR